MVAQNLWWKLKKRCWTKQQSATKWVETLRPKLGFFTVYKLQKEEIYLSSPIPSVQCCALVLATCRKQQTPQLWMEGTGEGCGFFCSPKLPYLSTMSQQFCRRLKLGFDVWVKFLNNSKSHAVFLFVIGFSCSSSNSVPHLWSNLLGSNFDLRKDQRKNFKKTIQTTENHKCGFDRPGRENTVSWLVKNDITRVWIEMISSLVG